jgi:2'-5' RNA ligase
MMKGNFSLWLMPPNDMSRRLKRFILGLSKRFASPAFEPHVTLLGRLEGTETELRSNASILASRLKPVLIQLEEVGYLDEYFRCLFIRVAQSRSLLDAYQTAVDIFGADKQSRFMPHLSLVYADLNNDVKLRIIQDIGTSFQDRFQVRSLHLYSTTGSPERWYCIGQFALGKRPLA